LEAIRDVAGDVNDDPVSDNNDDRDDKASGNVIDNGCWDVNVGLDDTTPVDVGVVGVIATLA
jgi:hypothetical protein